MDKKKIRNAACEVRQSHYVKTWQTDLMGAPGASLGYCCFSAFCSCCASYQLRKRALHGDMTRYTCCGGYLPCSGRCGEQNCPAFCLGMETVFCFAQSVASTRWMVQDEMQLQNTQCDNCLIATTIALQYISCIFSCIAMFVNVEGVREAAHIIDWIADAMWCSVCACMQTQHKVQLDARDADPSLIQPLNPYMAPIKQAMGVPVAPMAGEPVHGVPPQGAGAGYGYPPPPPQAGGYYPPPPSGYPSQQPPNKPY